MKTIRGNSRFKIGWDLMNLALVIAGCLLIPFQIAFQYVIDGRAAGTITSTCGHTTGGVKEDTLLDDLPTPFRLDILRYVTWELLEWGYIINFDGTFVNKDLDIERCTP